MRSLRGRLTIGVTAVVAVVILISGLSVSHFVARSERSSTDDRLERTAQFSQDSAKDSIENEIPLRTTRVAAVVRASRTSIRVTVGETSLPALGAPPPTPASPKNGLRTLQVDGKHYRIYTVPLNDASLSNIARLEVATRLEGSEQRQRQLNRNLAIYGGLALLVVALGTFFFTSFLLRPLQRLRGLTASIVSDEDLERHIPTNEGAGELRALATSFDAMLTRLSRSSRDRERALEATRRFAADAGHELRTPLTSVQANLSSLRRHPDIAVERRNALLDDAMSEQHRLVSLLDGLQALARGDATVVKHATVDLAELLDLTLEAARSRHPGTTFEAEIPDDEVEVEGWAPGLRLVCDNLVENAARHGRAGGTVHVALAKAVAGGADLLVEDDGAGVPEAQRAHVFEPFARVDGTTVAGSGLGLALVAQQVRLHGAQLELDDSELLGGARFRIAFVARPPKD